MAWGKGIYRSITALNVVEDRCSKTGIETLLLILFCLTSLISGIDAGFPSQIFMLKNDHQSQTASSPTGYTRIDCGLRPSYESFLETGKRITAGRYAEVGEFPWHVSIQGNGRHICGGTMISALWILTAAHCFAEEVPPDLTVVVGGIDLNLPLEEHKPDSLIIHENFDRISMENDIALILLSSPIEFSNQKIPICLPFIDNVDTWQHCWVSGWGTPPAAAGVPSSPVLQKARMKLISREQCLERIPHLEDNLFCAELEKGGGGACQVDSGGPLVCSYWHTMKWFQIGIVSWGEDCAEKPNHEILLSVYSYRSWIETETALRGKPFLIEGMDKLPNSGVFFSRAEKQLVFLEYRLLLFISLIAVRLL